MNKILVTGASGDIGTRTLLHLLKRKPARQLVGLARDPSKAADLATLGIEIRQGDYMDPESLSRAFRGVEKVMLISTHAFTDRNAAHAHVIEQAARAGVEHMVLMPIFRKADSAFTMKEITEEDIFAIAKVKASGLTYTLAQHPPFMEPVAMYACPNAAEPGVRVPAGSGKFTAATKDDLAAAHATLLTEEGHENKTYYLSGSPAVSFADIAQILSKIHGKKVPYVTISDEEYMGLIRASGMPEFVAPFILKWVQGMNQGEWDVETRDLEGLIDRSPTTPEQYLRQLSGVNHPSARVS